MYVLGFDFGLKYIGVAVGQTITKTAMPLASFLVKKNSVFYLKKIFECIDIWTPTFIIVGNPTNELYNNTHVLKGINEFVYKLRDNFIVPVYFVDERLSSWEAKTLCKKVYYKNSKTYFLHINSMSAAILIERWFVNH